MRTYMNLFLGNVPPALPCCQKNVPIFRILTLEKIPKITGITGTFKIGVSLQLFTSIIIVTATKIL